MLLVTAQPAEGQCEETIAAARHRATGEHAMLAAVHPQIQKARDLLPLIAAASAEHDEKRELSRPVVKALIDGGFFAMLKTKAVGGMELKHSTFAQVTEALASADASTGWVVWQSNGCSTTSAYLD